MSARNPSSHLHRIGFITYRNLRRLENILGHVSCTQCLANRFFDASHQLACEFEAGSHQQEQDHRLVAVPRPSLPDADRIRHFGGKLRVNYVVDLAGPKSDSRRIQHPVGATKEEDLFCDGVDADEVSVGPYICGFH